MNKHIKLWWVNSFGQRDEWVWAYTRHGAYFVYALHFSTKCASEWKRARRIQACLYEKIMPTVVANRNYEETAVQLKIGDEMGFPLGECMHSKFLLAKGYDPNGYFSFRTRCKPCLHEQYCKCKHKQKQLEKTTSICLNPRNSAKKHS